MQFQLREGINLSVGTQSLTKKKQYDLEKLFHEAILSNYEKASHKCKYSETRFLQMVEQYGGVRAAKKILLTERFEFLLSELGKCKCLNHSMESLVISQEYSILFTEDERHIARSRLRAYGFSGGLS
jgi:hypothetical protein